MTNTPEREGFSEEEARKGAAALRELYESVSFAGNIRPNPALADPDLETPGDEQDDDAGEENNV